MIARFELAPDGGVRFYSPFSRPLVDELKRRVPPDARRWDGKARAWVLDPAYVVPVADLCQHILGLRPGVLPSVVAATPPPVETRLLCVEYVGAGRERPDGGVTCSAWADLAGGAAGDWSVVLPVATLRAWFEPGYRPPAAQAPRAGPPTYYALLGIAPDADAAAVKAGYRRMARSVHPDVNREPDAGERFIAVQRAYEVLADAGQRRRYDVALRLEAQAGAPPPSRERDADVGYRAPLPCGWVLAEGRMRLGRFVVARIVSWEDIVENGKVLVSTWPPGADAFERVWVTP